MGVDFDGLKIGRKFDELLALRVMGWEKLTVGYEGTKYETPRQKELVRWLRKVGIESIGDYFIDVERNLWTPVEDFKPSRDIMTAWHVFDRVRNLFPAGSPGWDMFAVSLGVHPCIPGAKPEDNLASLHRMTPFTLCRAALRAVVSSAPPAQPAEDPALPCHPT